MKWSRFSLALSRSFRLVSCSLCVRSSPRVRDDERGKRASARQSLKQQKKMIPPQMKRATSNLEALEGGIMGDEHRLRKAQIRHREMDLEGRRVDARITSLETLATQATLLAGFSYAVLRPDSIHAILSPEMATAFGLLVSICTVASFCSALWVVYLTGYVSIVARVTFLQGTRTRAVDATIAMLIETQNRARFFFDLSMGSLVVGAMADVLHNGTWFFAFILIAVFVVFVLNGAFYKRRIDMELGKWTSSDLMPDNFPAPVAHRLDKLETWLHETATDAKQQAAHALKQAHAQTRDVRVRVARAVKCVPWLSDFIASGDYSVLWELGGVASYQSAMASTSFASDDGRSSGQQRSARIDGAHSTAMHRCASSAALTSAPPQIVRVHSSSTALYPLTFRGWCAARALTSGSAL